MLNKIMLWLVAIAAVVVMLLGAKIYLGTMMKIETVSGYFHRDGMYCGVIEDPEEELQVSEEFSYFYAQHQRYPTPEEARGMSPRILFKAVFDRDFCLESIIELGSYIEAEGVRVSSETATGVSFPNIDCFVIKAVIQENHPIP